MVLLRMGSVILRRVILGRSVKLANLLVLSERAYLMVIVGRDLLAGWFL